MWDKKGENLAFKWFRMLSEQNQDKLAIIVGDSQTAYSGRRLENILKRKGYEVIRKFKTGENTNKTIQRLSTISPDRPVSLVAVFTGGNNPNAAFSETATANLIELIRRKFGEGVEIVIGAAPPARTGNPATVKRVFGRDSHSESLKARRREMADAIVTTANSMGVKAVNPHTAEFLDDDINTGDGIHLKDSDAQNFAEAMASQITGKANAQAPISAVIKDFSGKRLATSKLRGLDLVQLARYAKSRASACQGMGYFTIGSKGDKVKQIQDRLAELGLNPPTKDEDAYGTFDLRTLYNTIAFQKMSKIRTDGCVGPETMGALGLKDKEPTRKKQTRVVTLDSGVKIKGLTSNQKQVADMIFRKYSEAGLSVNIAAAAVVNGVKESGLKNYLVGDGGNSVGLFQLHRGSKRRPFWQSAGLDPDVAAETRKQFRERCVRQGLPPGGYKCSVRATGMKKFAKERESAGDWRFNPEKNTEAIIDVEVKRGAGRKLRAADKAGASIPELAAIFSRDIERPADKEGNMRKRRKKAIAMFGNVRLDDKV